MIHKNKIILSVIVLGMMMTPIIWAMIKTDTPLKQDGAHLTGFAKDTYLKIFPVIAGSPENISYKFYYQINEAGEKPLDILFNLPDDKQNISLSLRGLKSREMIQINPQNISAPADWAGRLSLDIKGDKDKICIEFLSRKKEFCPVLTDYTERQT